MSRRKNVVANMTEECTVCLMGGLSRFVGQCVLKGESRCALLFKKVICSVSPECFRDIFYRLYNLLS